MTKQELEDLTFAHVSTSLVERLLSAVFLAHDVAAQHCKAEFEPSEAANLRPYYKRAKLEAYIRGAAEMDDRVLATAVRAPIGGWYHTELRAGPIILTANAVQTPCGLVERAEFRMTLASGNEQLSLWDDPREVSSEARPLHVLLLHAASTWDTPQDAHAFGHLPGSVYLAYPSPDLGSYVHSINLFERFPMTVARHLPQEWDQEARVRYFGRARSVRAA